MRQRAIKVAYMLEIVTTRLIVVNYSNKAGAWLCQSDSANRPVRGQKTSAGDA